MGKVMFYHLTRSRVEAALPPLIGRAMEQGWRIAVRGTDSARMDWLDARLWIEPEDAFLPHGRAGGPHDAGQPVLLTTARDCPNGALCLVAIDGADVAAEEARAMERVCVLFDGNDDAAVTAARAQWAALTGAGLAAQYWSEESGRWQMKTEKTAAEP